MNSEHSWINSSFGFPKVNIISPKEYTNIVETQLQSQSEIDYRLIPVDCTWYLPTSTNDADQEFHDCHIPNAVRFDLDVVKDSDSPYPHMFPSISKFEIEVRKLGIRNNDIIVCYDQQGNFSSSRVAVTFSIFNKNQKVFVLDNFPEYKKCGYPTSSCASKLEFDHEVTKITCSDYTVNPEDTCLDCIISFEQLSKLVLDEDQFVERYTIIDARPYGRWSGVDPEPRKGLSSGHIPHSISIPFKSVLTENNSYKSEKELKKIFESSGVEIGDERTIIVMCGTGVTACIIITALDIAKIGGKDSVKIYDGSWTEWAMRERTKL